MSRFDRHHFDYEYGPDPWDTPLFSDQGRDYSRVGLGLGAAATVIGYGGDGDFDQLEPRSRARRRSRTNRHREPSVTHSHRSAATTTGPTSRPNHRSRHRSKPNSTSTSTLTSLTDRDHLNVNQLLEKESLQRRLCLDRDRSISYRSRPRQRVRARSLSLSRLDADDDDLLGSGYLSAEDDDDDHVLNVLEEPEGTWAVTAGMIAASPPTPMNPAPPGYYRQQQQQQPQQRVSLSSPRVPLAGAGWPLVSTRPASREREGRRRDREERERYERGYQVVDLGFDFEGGLDHLSGVSVSGRGGEGMPVGFRLPNPRVPAGTRRSESFEERWEGRGKKGVSPGPMAARRARSKYRPPKTQYNQVHALILTWEFHDLRTEDYTAPPASDYVSLEEETARLRDTLEGYGYQVHEFLIPMHRPVEAIKAKLKQFCRYAADDTLLMIYYHGHGALDTDNELVFSSHDHPDSPEWSKAAAAELYAALLHSDACPSHGRRDKYKELIKKYERYRPVATIKWDAIRSTILETPCDVLLVLDCCAAGGANLCHVNWQPPPGTEFYTKHLFAACGFESSTSDDMTAALCEVLDEWVAPPPAALPPAGGVAESGVGSRKSSISPGPKGAGGVGGGGVANHPNANAGVALTTKRLHQLVEDKLQKRSVGSQPIFKQLLPLDPEQYITLPNLRDRDLKMSERRGRRGHICM